MTCQSCVKNIEEVISTKPGVIFIKVSLEMKEAQIQFNPQITNPEVLREQIEDMGFEASLPPTSLTNGFDDIARRPNANGTSNHSNVTINVEGMTCQSCVKNIEGVIGEKPGVISIEVSLTKKNATINYDASLTDPEKLRDAIDDMGFEATLRDKRSDSLSEFDPLKQKKDKTEADTIISVEGMTCISCVKNIEGTMSDFPGVVKICVSLSDKQATVKYDPNITTPQLIAERIDDMGFEAAVVPENKGSENNVNFTSISVKGMTCNSCVKNIEDVIGGRPGIVTIKVRATKPKKVNIS